MAKHRPISERMEALQAQMVALQTKQNKEAVDADPQVQAVDAQIHALNNEALKWKRWSKDAQQKIVEQVFLVFYLVLTYEFQVSLL